MMAFCNIANKQIYEHVYAFSQLDYNGEHVSITISS